MLPTSSVSVGRWKPFCSAQLPEGLGIRVFSRMPRAARSRLANGMPKSVGTSLRLNTPEGEGSRKTPAKANFRVQLAAVLIINPCLTGQISLLERIWIWEGGWFPGVGAGGQIRVPARTSG